MKTKMVKVAYNACHGGFSISDAAIHRYAEIKGIKLYPELDEQFGHFTTYWTVPKSERKKSLEGADWHNATLEERQASNKAYDEQTIGIRDFSRTDPVLIQVIEELGKKANGMCASLAVAKVPKGAKYRIDEYDGAESVMTPDDYEWEVA